MSKDTRRHQRAVKADIASSPGCEPPVVSNNAGRVKHDDRGNAIWEWAKNTEESGETPTVRLKKLDNPALMLADDGTAPPDVVTGYSPYDSGVLAKPGVPRKKKDLRRLSEWLKLKKQSDCPEPDDE